eukprot:1161885-Pelagomonas_calceolata.AAC.7
MDSCTVVSGAAAQAAAAAQTALCSMLWLGALQSCCGCSRLHPAGSTPQGRVSAAKPLTTVIHCDDEPQHHGN